MAWGSASVPPGEAHDPNGPQPRHDRSASHARRIRFNALTALTLQVADSSSDPTVEKPCPHTALKALSLVAREQGLDVVVDQIIHEHVIGNHEVDDSALVRIAGTSGLKARAVTLDWDSLIELNEAVPCVLRLRNGNCMVLMGLGKKGGTPVVLLRDPSVASDDLLVIDRFRLEQAWDGGAILVKRLYGGFDGDDQPFGFGTFIDEIMRHKALFRDVGITAILLTFLTMSLPIFIQLVIDKVLLHNSSSTLTVLLIGMVMALMFEAAFTYLRQYLVLYATLKIDSRINTRIFRKMIGLPMSFFERTSTGVLVKNMQQSEKVRNFLTGQLFTVALDSIALVFLIPVMFLYDATLSMVVLGFTLLLCGIIAGIMPLIKVRMMEVYQAEAEVQSFLVETIQGLRTVKSLALDSRKKLEWGQRIARSINLRFNLMTLANVIGTITAPLQKLMMVTVIAVGAYKVFDHQMQVGALIAFNIISMRIVQPLVQLAGLAQQWQEAMISVKMLGTVMNQQSEQGRGRRGLRMPVRARVEFEDIRLRDSPEAAPALDRVSFTVPEGTIFGLMGRSGSGKTTVTRMLQGLHFAQEGLIKIDGHDLREIDLDWLRTNIGVVLQDNFLFRGTIRDNIAAGKSNATIEEVIRAARLAGADEFIERLPRGFDTQLEEGSANLSGGQRQRLAIARALLLDPPILILDEATSALDPESESIVQANLLSIAAGRTLIIISHRLTALVPADQILVMERGRAEDIGTHQELLGRCALYKHMWDRQNRQG